MTDRWTYVVPFIDATGEQQTVVVTLTDAERLHALYHLALRGPQGPGGDRGPIVNAYAIGHAKSRIPPDAAIDWDGKIERVVLD